MVRHSAARAVHRASEPSLDRPPSSGGWVIFALQATTPFVVAILMLVWQALLGGAR